MRLIADNTVLPMSAWIIPAGIAMAMVFAVGFVSWLEKRLVFDEFFCEMLILASLTVMLLSIGSLITLLLVI